MKGGNLYDPGLHLFVDDVEVQDHPGFTRVVQEPARVQRQPVVRSERSWEGQWVSLWGSVLYDEEEDLFKMWYDTSGPTESGEEANFVCYATSKDGIDWHKPELGINTWQRSTANNIVFPTPQTPPGHGMDVWGVVKEPQETDPSKRYKVAFYQQQHADVPKADHTNTAETRKVYMWSIRERHGMYVAHSPDGLHWSQDDKLYIRRAGDAGSMVYDPMHRRYIAVSRRHNTIMDHFVLQWKQYRRVIALSTSEDFEHWTPLQTVLKPDDFDDGRDQLYNMVPFVYGNQYLGFVWRYHTAMDQGVTELAAARDIQRWQRVGQRQHFLPVGTPGAWDDGWATCSLNPPILKDNTLHMWYSGMRRHGSNRPFLGGIGALTLRKDGFVALRCGNQGGDVMTEPVRVEKSRLFLNASAFPNNGSAGRLRVRVVCDIEIPEGFSLEECNGLVRDDQTDFEITWGEEHRNLSRFVGEKVRLHIQADAPANIYSYRFG